MGLNTPFGRFFCSARRASSAGQVFDHSTCDVPLQLNDLFPCGFPHPEVYTELCPPASSRRRARWCQQRELRRRLNS
eukprot:6486732-Amphidinium_carterae.1